MLFAQASVTPVIGFQPRVEILQGIGSEMNVRIFQVIEHIWQGIVNQYNCAAQVFVCNAAGSRPAYVVGILSQPASIIQKKCIPLTSCPNPAELRQKLTQLFASFTLRIGPQPPTTFSLQVVQAALQISLGPDQAHCSQDRALPITRNKLGTKSLLSETAKPRVSCQEGLLLNIQMSYDPAVYAIHQIKQTSILMKIGSIINHRTHPSVVNSLSRGLFKPVANKVAQCTWAIARKLAELSNRVALPNPQLEPVLATVESVIASPPDEGAPALQALETLFGQSRSAMQFNGV